MIRLGRDQVRSFVIKPSKIGETRVDVRVVQNEGVVSRSCGQRIPPCLFVTSGYGRKMESVGFESVDSEAGDISRGGSLERTDR